MANIVYKEKSKFDDKALLLLLFIFLFVTVWGFMKMILWGQFQVLPFLLFVVIITCLSYGLYWLLHLQFKITISKEYLKFKMSPIHARSHKIYWKDVIRCEVIETPAAAQWHGSNIRFGGTSWFSLSGKNGLFIRTKDGSNYFIGCRDLDKLRKALKKI